MMADDQQQAQQAQQQQVYTQAFRGQPVTPMDIYSFTTMIFKAVETAGAKQPSRHFYWTPTGSNIKDSNQVSTAWIVGFVKQCRIRAKVETENDQPPVYNLDLEIRDGTGELKVVQFKTSLGGQHDTKNSNATFIAKESPFRENEYYSFLIKPLLQKQNPQKPQSEEEAIVQGYLVGYSKITNFNEVTYHLSEFVRAYSYMMATTHYLINRIIRTYSQSGFAVTKANIFAHLRNHPEENSKILDEYLDGYLVKYNFVTLNENGYLWAEEQQQQQQQ